MGARNVGLVYVTWPDLSHRAFRALVYMALKSLDDPGEHNAARTYFGGRPGLALALGVVMPDEPIPGDSSDAAVAARGQRHSALVRVDQVLRELVKAGAIRKVRNGSSKRTAAYELELDPWNQRHVVRGTNVTLSTEPTPRWFGGQRGVVQEEEEGTKEEKGRNQGAGEPGASGSPDPLGDDPDPEYTSVRLRLTQVAPEVHRRALEQVQGEMPNASTRDRVFRVAELVSGAAP